MPLRSRVRLLASGTALALGASCGCATLHQKPAEENVMAAREQAREGMDAIVRSDWATAEEQFRHAVETCPTDKDARRHYAETLWRRGKADEAITQMHEAVRLSGGEPEMLVLLGEMELAYGKPQQAFQRSEAALAQNRRLATAWALRGDALRNTKNPTEAMASYHRALSCQPRMPRVQVALAEMYLEVKRPQRSLATLHALAEQLGPHQTPGNVLHLQGLALGAMGRHADAVDALTLASHRGDASPEVLCHLAQAHLALGDAANARLAVDRALAISPEHSQGQKLMAQIDEIRRVALLMP